MLSELEDVVEDHRQILTLRLLIARAANMDSLAWWDDDSLSSSGAYLLERIFPVAPQTAARSLSLQAAFSRHQAAFEDESQALHLFHLDSANEDDLTIRQVALTSIPVPEEPINTMDALRVKLIQLTGEPKPYKRGRQTGNRALFVEIPSPPGGMSLWLHRSQTLAWAYLEGTSGEPVFPFALEKSLD